MDIESQSSHTRAHITFIGSGNVATHLAIAFSNKGHIIEQIYSPTFEHAQELATIVGASATNQIGHINKDSDFYIIAVNDNCIANVAENLSLQNGLTIHTSGATPLSVLQPTKRPHGVLWSPTTFVRNTPMAYDHIPLCIEGSDATAETRLLDLASSISDSVHHLNYTQRLQTHLAAVWVNNFGNALHALAQDFLIANNIDYNLLLPIIEQTTQKAASPNIWLQQTGPAARRDISTITRHQQMLSNEPQMSELYNLMTKLIISHTPDSNNPNHVC